MTARVLVFKSTVLVYNDQDEYMLIHLETAELIEKGKLSYKLDGVDR